MVKFYDLHDYFSPPFKAVEEALQAQDRTKEELIKYLGISNDKYQDYLSGKKPINKTTSKKLGEFFGVDVEHFLRVQDFYNENKKHYKEEEKLFNKFKKTGKIGDFIKPDAEELDIMGDIFNFFNASSLKEALQKKKDNINCSAMFRGDKSVDPSNLSIWLQHGENAFSGAKKEPYSKNKLKQYLDNKNNYVKYLSDASKHEESFNEFVEVLASFGVVLVETPNISKAPYGATRWFNGNPLIQVSKRYPYYDNFWFTVFHELGHVLLHEGKNMVDIEEDEKSDCEQEANKFALEKIFSSQYKLSDIDIGYLNTGTVENMANKYSLDSSFILGQFLKTDTYKNLSKKFFWVPKNRNQKKIS